MSLVALGLVGQLAPALGDGGVHVPLRLARGLGGQTQYRLGLFAVTHAVPHSRSPTHQMGVGFPAPLAGLRKNLRTAALTRRRSSALPCAKSGDAPRDGPPRPGSAPPP